jgi:hypothetical protein
LELASALQQATDFERHSFVKTRHPTYSLHPTYSSPGNRLPCWWKTELRGKHLPDFWPHNDGKGLYRLLGTEACEELSNWWDQRNERKRNGRPKFPKDCVSQLECYFSSSHGSVRQVIMAWRRDRDAQRIRSFDGKVLLWRERVEEHSSVENSRRDSCNQTKVEAVAASGVFSSKGGAPRPITDADESEKDWRTLSTKDVFEEGSCEKSIMLGSESKHAYAAGVVSETMSMDEETKVTGPVDFTPSKNTCRLDLKMMNGTNQRKSNDEVAFSEDYSYVQQMLPVVGTILAVAGQDISVCGECTSGVNTIGEPESLATQDLERD